MKKFFKWFGIIIGSLVLLIVLAIAFINIRFGMRLDKSYTVETPAVTIPTDSASLSNGKRLASIHCAGCHGENLEGTVFFDDPSLGKIPASNLTKGKGGVGNFYKDIDWVRAIRHGIRPKGTPLLIMPAEDYYFLSDSDLGSIIAHIKTLPSKDNETGSPQLTILAKTLMQLGAFGDIIKADIIDHTGKRPVPSKPGVTIEYGQYLSQIGGCFSCHGKDLAGFKDPNPNAPFSPNLTKGGVLANMNEADFIKSMRTGEGIGGRKLSDFMPWKFLGRMSNDELKAIYLYVASLPAKETTKQ